MRDFIVKGRWLTVMGAALMLGGTSAASAAVIAFDDFERAAQGESDNLGATSVGGFNWIESEAGPGNLRLVEDTGAEQFAGSAPTIRAASFNTRGSATDASGMLGLSLDDVEVSADIRANLAASNNFWVGLMYRQPAAAAFASNVGGGYVAELTQGPWAPPGIPAGTVRLRWANGTVLASTLLPGPLLSDGTDHELKVVAVGDNHQVFWDGGLLINYNETTAGRDGPGDVGMGTWYGNFYVDNFSVSLIPEPASMVLLGLGSAGLLLARRR